MLHSRRRPEEFARRDRRGGVRATVHALVERLQHVVVTQGGLVADGLTAIHTHPGERRVLLEAAGPLVLRPGPAELRALAPAGHVRMPALVLDVDDTVATVHLDVARAELGGRRRDERFPLMVRIDGDDGWRSLTRNVSASGALVRARLAAGSSHRVQVALPGLELVLDANVVRLCADGSALEFPDLGDDARGALRCALLRSALRP